MKNVLALILSFVMLFTCISPVCALTIGETADVSGVYGERAVVIGKAQELANQFITILLLNGDGSDTSASNILYVDTATADENGYYEFKIKYEGFTIDNGIVNNCTLKVKAGANDITDTVLSATVSKTEMLAVDLKSSLGEDEAKATATINNLYGVALDAVVMLAAYDVNNKLLGVAQAKKEITEETDSLSVSYANVPEGFDRMVAFIWDSAESLIPYTAQQNVEFAENNISSLVINPGSDETKRRFVWYNDQMTIGAKLQYALKEDYVADGGFTSENSFVVEATTQIPTSNKEDVSCKAEIENLELGKEYVYRVGNKYHFDDNVYSFNTYDVENDGKQTFALVSDLHNSVTGTSRIDFFDNVYDSILKQYPDTQFIVSTGDNISQGNMGFDIEADPETYRLNGEIEMLNMFKPEVYSKIPFASTLGNHELSYVANPVSSVTKWHFNHPNEDGYSGTFPGTDTHGNFWFRNGDVLIVGVNISQGGSGVYAGGTAAVTKAYIENAVNANTDAKWKVLVTHIPPYSFTGSFGETYNLRKRFSDMQFDTFDFDVVFSGHQHGYSRSKQLLTDDASNYVTYQNASGSSYNYIQPQVVSEDKITHSTDSNGYQIDTATNPEGTVHINVAPLYPMATNNVVPDYNVFTEAYANKAGSSLVYNNSSNAFNGANPISYSKSTCVMVTVENIANGQQMKIELVENNGTETEVSGTGTVLDTYIIKKTN